jgi:hypothetical protein
MTAEAPSAVPTEESPQSVVDAGASEGASPAPPGSNGAAAPGAELSYRRRARDDARSNGDSPNGAATAGTGTPETAPAAPGTNGSAASLEPSAGTASAEVEQESVEQESVEQEPAEQESAEQDPVEQEPVEQDTAAEDEVLAAEVAEQLGSVVGEDVQADPAEFAAAAVLDVLRASGWADAAEASVLRAEATRLRELLSEVIRDHRAREASAAGVENQQLHWLVPLLRASHGVAFGSLGAKVALRTAVQGVPPEVLASAGLRIDYGIEPPQDEEG